MKEEERRKGEEMLIYMANVSVKPVLSEDKGDGVRIAVFT
jgi:hypothetical protein